MKTALLSENYVIVTQNKTTLLLYILYGNYVCESSAVG